ncbi:MAG TPA: hypothetical protein PKM60_02960 [Zoogloea sp.]|uniref:O-antigen ligase family protein n=1 Tax=Zoogloea sp. TaxID=49181 RepID=UPI002BA8E8D2|nr:hypothetical protein [Zoogloea sp.]HOB45102.1 hypothetical protein [Zoogloea sp.]HQA09247.1 hypothetical protein [Zoogloea sp.]HQE37688.1 hypothetical protein [Zoogloea sp.]
MNTTLFPCAPVAASSTFEQRVARGLTWGLFVALWGKLLVSVLLTQPVIDAEAESLYNRLADALLLGVLLAGLLTYADAILRRAPLMLAVVPFGLASFLTTELLSGLNFSTAVFEYLKIVTPALMSVLLLRLFEREPALAIRLMKATLALIWGLVIVALIFLPPSLNRGGELFWPVYFASLHTSSYLVVVCAALSLYLFEAGELGRRTLIGLLVFSVVLVFHGWGVRTSMVAALAFGIVVLIQRTRLAPVALFVLLVVGLAAAFVPLLFGLIHLPSWDEMVELTSGRFSMWLQKIDILANSSLSEWLFGHGEGSDWIVSEVWWWSAKDSHNDFIRLLNQQGLVGLGAVLAVLAVWARSFPPGVAAPLLAALVASTAFSNGIMFRPQAGLIMPLALVAAAAAWQRRQAEAEA